MREGGSLEGGKEGLLERWIKKLTEEFEVGGFMAQKGLCNIAKERRLEEKGAFT